MIKQSARKINEVEVARYKEIFTFYDKDADGFASISQLGNMIRASNYYPTEKEIIQWMNMIDTKKSDLFDFPEFISLLGIIPKPSNPEEELMDAFRVFDKTNSGIITTQELKHVIRGLGECFSDEEAETMITEADPRGIG